MSNYRSVVLVEKSGKLARIGDTSGGDFTWNGGDEAKDRFTEEEQAWIENPRPSRKWDFISQKEGCQILTKTGYVSNRFHFTH